MVSAFPNSFLKRVEPQLVEVGEERLEKMGDAGISVQVLSVSGVGADLLDEQAGPALALFGIDRILFSVGYPFSTNEQDRAFLDSINLPSAELEKIAHGNADQLLMLRA